MERRKRWAIAGGVVALWVVLWAVTGSATSATVVLVVIAGLGVAAVLGLRGLGVDRHHPWAQRLSGRRLDRDGEFGDYPRRELDDYPRREFGQPRREFDDPEREYAAAPTYAHREGYPDPHGGWHVDSAPTFGENMPTVMERALVPKLRLVTGESVAETRMSGAVAGRGNVELRLPHAPTVSREHAKLTFSDGQWRIANLGMNGITVNGTPLEGEQVLADGDEIRWGMRPEAPVSRVELD
jgi:hypothetical protein